MIDTNVALHQIDALEYKCQEISFILILQTVLQEIKHLNISVFRRFSVLLKSEKKLFVFYPNELSKYTLEHR